MHIAEMNVPIDTFTVDRKTKVKAVMALIRADALDLLPVLFAPVVGRAPKGLEGR